MVRPSELKHRFTTNVTFESEDYEQFEKLVGKGNVSKELRAFIKDRVTQQKNEQAHNGEHVIDPLGLSSLTQKHLLTYISKTEDKGSRQSTLFETFASRDRRNEINSYVKSIKDIPTLNTLVQNASCMLGVAKTHRDVIRVYPRQ